ncbi:MAG: DUF1707 domain-containing protein [Nocardioides sp.]
MAEEWWREFAHDPRDPAHAPLRASDRDRDLVTGVLSSAYADGRLDQAEHEERASQAARARTLGDLPPLVVDLVATAASTTSLEQRAHQAWRERRDAAVFGLIGSAIVCWAIWAGLGADGFMWPIVVNALAAMHLTRTVATRREIVASELRRLEKQQAKQLRRRTWKPGPS